MSAARAGGARAPAPALPRRRSGYGRRSAAWRSGVRRGSRAARRTGHRGCAPAPRTKCDPGGRGWPRWRRRRRSGGLGPRERALRRRRRRGRPGRPVPGLRAGLSRCFGHGGRRRAPGRATDAGAGILSPATSAEADDETWPFLAGVRCGTTGAARAVGRRRRRRGGTRIRASVALLALGLRAQRGASGSAATPSRSLQRGAGEVRDLAVRGGGPVSAARPGPPGAA